MGCEPYFLVIIGSWAGMLAGSLLLLIGFFGHRSTWTRFAIPAILLSLLANYFAADQAWQNRSSMADACKSNLKNISIALEMYSTDFDGLYPPSLERLSPMYLRQAPRCPSSGKEYVYEVGPQERVIKCSDGHPTSKLPPGSPYYTTLDGGLYPKPRKPIFILPFVGGVP